MGSYPLLQFWVLWSQSPHSFGLLFSIPFPPTHESQHLWHSWQFMDTLTDTVLTFIHSPILNYKDLAAVHKTAYLSVIRKDEHTHSPPPPAKNHTIKICLRKKHRNPRFLPKRTYIFFRRQT